MDGLDLSQASCVPAAMALRTAELQKAGVWCYTGAQQQHLMRSVDDDVTVCEHIAENPEADPLVSIDYEGSGWCRKP